MMVIRKPVLAWTDNSVTGYITLPAMPGDPDAVPFTPGERRALPRINATGVSASVRDALTDEWQQIAPIADAARVTKEQAQSALQYLRNRGVAERREVPSAVRTRKGFRAVEWRRAPESAAQGREGDFATRTARDSNPPLYGPHSESQGDMAGRE